MAKVIDLRNFYEIVTRKCNGKYDYIVPPFLSSASAFSYTCKGIYKFTFL